ncbi:tRNA 2-thiouridine(34) synthase MnmA [Thermospira aquatica]|uniref:tRNA-specific 2-thiouridylase MnmA n=1 Tax=Thermospira aquatica TaxID=2828656 RepID=A0AAX3BEP6_9SPIR|nr:tRNA 2-thiouridine(34) synthase MnmA [Thermospira aquatica]URA10787.1 tRNA 2-thiouridine(34) synthase MnmA [Thermospira aquatica]
MKRVFVGMSGGIDSSAAAFLLKEAGYAVEGVTFVAALETGTKKCCSLEEIESARKVCRFLGIPHHVIDLKDVFEARVIRYFVEEYQQGLVPNPCVMCNRHIKFGALVEESLARGADMVATGHYARILPVKDGFGLFCGKDTSKDQSYFLSYVKREMFSYVLLPLGEMTKSEVRKLISDSGMPISSSKTESQDVCFVPGDYRDYLRARGVKSFAGDFVYQGQVVGKHEGVAFYSLGQRRGLKIAIGKRLYVRAIDAQNNRIILGELPKSRKLWLRELNLLVGDFEEGEYEIQLRYQSKRIKGWATWEEDRLALFLSQPAEIVTPGQLGVLYRNDQVMAAGIIDKTLLEEEDAV